MSTKIGHFEILSELATSATGTVYKANDTQTSQTVVLKVIQLSAFGERAGELEKCLLEETEAIKTLSHSNIAPVYGAGMIDGSFCAAMEYIQGNSIATMLARKEGFSIWDLLDIGRQVCSGLDHTHSHNIFHCSLEPGKIMCGWDGTVRILSYGVSCVGKFAGQMPGVPSLLHYMSPEQIRGEGIDARSNLFSVGAIFYEMVTDRKAFDGEDSDFLRRSIVEGLPVAPVLVNPKIHPALSDLIMKAMAKDPTARYQSGRELLGDLERCKESKPQKQATSSAPAQSGIPAPPTSAATKPLAAKASGNSTEKIAVPPVAAKAAASAAGSSGSQAAASASVKASHSSQTRATASMSSAALDEPAAAAAQPPRIATDPLMGEAGPTRGGVSFSEMTELPPLKEVYVAPPPPPPPAVVPEAGPSQTVYEQKAEKPKVQPRDVAKKAINEVKSVPPRLMIYSIAGAIIVILIITVVLLLHINGLNSDGDSPRSTAANPTTQTAPAQRATPAQPTPSEPVQPAATNIAPVAAPLEDAVTTPWVAATPEKSRNTKRRSSGNGSAAPLLAPGQIAVDSAPQGAQVQIDGKTDPAWVTPFSLSGLAPGQHSVTFSKAGYSSDSTTVAVNSGGKASVTGRLTQLVATLAVASNPPGANIFIDGRNSGKLTPAQVSVDKGQHVVLVRKSGFIDETTNAQFAPGQTVNFSPALRPLGNVDDIKTVGKMKKLFGGKESKEMGTVTVKTQPKGAQVAVNQHMLEKDSPVEFMLDPGNYIVDITLSGYAPIHRIITVDKGSKAVIDEVLQHE